MEANMVFERKRSGIIRRTERAMTKVMSAVKLINRRNTKELMQINVGCY